MTVQLNWPPDIVDQLTRQATSNGLSLDAYILQVVLVQRGLDTDGHSTAAADLIRKREEAAASIRESRKRNILGPDLTVRDLIEEGRRF